MKPEIDWIIHCVANGAMCAACGKVENGFPPYICNAHTHGMERYGHMDFQVVLFLPTQEIGRILNTMGLRVQAGEHFKAGDFVSGIYEDCDIRLDEFEETGRKVLRVVIPDQNNAFPDDPRCMEVYRLQAFETDLLYENSDFRP